jgi:hypothetical protein
MDENEIPMNNPDIPSCEQIPHEPCIHFSLTAKMVTLSPASMASVEVRFPEHCCEVGFTMDGTSEHEGSAVMNGPDGRAVHQAECTTARFADRCRPALEIRGSAILEHLNDDRSRNKGDAVVVGLVERVLAVIARSESVCATARNNCRIAREIQQARRNGSLFSTV